MDHSERGRLASAQASARTERVTVSTEVNDGQMLDPRYVAARRVLLDALVALAPHGKAIIVAGA